jgi:hypothetical protein
MIISLFLSCKQEAYKTPASENLLPVGVWRRIIDYLTMKEQDACTLVSKQLAILTLCDPSADLEEMDKRKIPICISSKLSPSEFHKSTLGPTGSFLAHPDPDMEDCFPGFYQSVKETMHGNPNVGQTVRNVCAIESAHPEHIPLYHGGRLEARVSMLFIHTLLSAPYSKTEKFPCLNPMIKFPSPIGPKTIEEAFSTFPRIFNDHMPVVRQELLSCNPFLFAQYFSTGESSWDFYLSNYNVYPQSSREFFQELCKKYHIKPHEKHLQRLEALYEELCQLANAFSGEKREGILLQLLVPPAVLDKMAYASIEYGRPFKSSKPLSERCLAFRKDHLSDTMQVRLLVQSIFIPEYGIKVYTHGCGGFFSEEGSPDLLSAQKCSEQKARLLRKEKIIEEARDIFTKMILLSPKKVRKPIGLTLNS